MNITTVIVLVFLPVACIAAAAALMRLFDVKDATTEQARSEAESWMVQPAPVVKVRRRIRAGAPGHVALADFPRLSSLGVTRIRSPSV